MEKTVLFEAEKQSDLLESFYIIFFEKFEFMTFDIKYSDFTNFYETFEKSKKI